MTNSSLWYAIPLGGSVTAGAAVYGAYGFVRAHGAPLVALAGFWGP